MSALKIGVSAVQGAFAEHCAMVRGLGAEAVEIRAIYDLEDIDALILPGGESTVQGKLLKELGLFSWLKSMIAQGLPVYGTCAGMILLAADIENDSRRHFAVMDISVKRNAYGRQLGSTILRGSFAGMEDVPMPFIRAPYIYKTGTGVEILSERQGFVTAARQDKMLATAFHPEMTEDIRVHEYFLKMI